MSTDATSQYTNADLNGCNRPSRSARRRQMSPHTALNIAIHLPTYLKMKRNTPRHYKIINTQHELAASLKREIHVLVGSILVKAK